MRVCIVGASGKLGQYLVQHARDRGYEVAGVCREQSIAKLDALTGRITVVPGATDDREVIRQAVAGCDGVLAVLVPRVSTATRQGPLSRCSTSRHPARGWCCPAAGISPVTGRTSTRAGSSERLLSWAGSASLSGRSTSMTAMLTGVTEVHHG